MQRFVFTLALVFWCGAALSTAFDKEAAMAKVMELMEACKGEVGASQTDIDDLLHKEPATSAEGKCLRACVMKKMNFMTADGKLDKAGGREKAKQFTDNDPAKMKIADAIGDVCAAIPVSSDHCEAAEQYGKCFKEQAIKHGVFHET